MSLSKPHAPEIDDVSMHRGRPRRASTSQNWVDAKIRNAEVLTGHVHRNWANDLKARGTGRDWELTSQFVWSDGGVQTLQMVQIPETILRKSCGALEDGHSALESYVSSVRRTVAKARALAEGESVEVPVLAGCYSASLAGGASGLRVSQGRLRAKTAVDHVLVGGSESVVLDLATKFSLVKRFEYRPEGRDFVADWPRTSEAEMASAEAFREGVQEHISTARMAILLSSKDEEVLAIGQSFMAVINP